MDAVCSSTGPTSRCWRSSIFPPPGTRSGGTSGDDVALEIFYHKGHEFNVDRMMESLKASLQEFLIRSKP